MKKKSTSRQLVIDCITTSLLMLMEQKEYSKITITDITNKAGVSRMAFYRNYETKDDILLYHCDELFEPIDTKIKNNEYKDSREFLGSFIQTIQDNHLFFNSLIKAQIIDVCWEYYIKHMQKNLKEYLESDMASPRDEYVFHFFTGGLMNVMKAWAYNGTQLSSEDMLDLLNDILNKLKPDAFILTRY
ncbi:MAG: TetR/AcrR family transcriptional regulator [Lachnospiraceae bacterium]